MKKIILSSLAAILVAGTFVFASNIKEDNACCKENSECCYAGSVCCKK